MTYIYRDTGVSRNAPFYLISSAAGTIVKFAAALEGHLSVGSGDITLQMSIGGVDVSLGLLTLTSVGTVFSVVPTASNVVTDNQIITITPNIPEVNDNRYICIQVAIHILRS